ncbi:MAG: TIGR02281 family clan AA aspartic protease [Gammaproteobacteria bacterium]|nr:TIGR02281 family clan AA aspartic protease [Gammaproteobacteria bacterium]
MGYQSAHSAGLVKVMALFSGKAMIEIDGKRRLLREGEESPEGVRLVSSNARGAVLEINGRREDYALGASYGGRFAQPDVREVRIARNNQGAYITVGSINGRTTDMLVDTGATSVAMSEVEARRLGIPYRIEGTRSGVHTASGFANAHAVTLRQVRVGDIELANVEAVVIEGDSPRQVLLGMSFLEAVEMDVQGTVLVLRSKY